MAGPCSRQKDKHRDVGQRRSSQAIPLGTVGAEKRACDLQHRQELSDALPPTPKVSPPRDHADDGVVQIASE